MELTKLEPLPPRNAALNKALTIFAVISLLLFAATAATIGYWWLWPYNPLQIKSLTVTPKTVFSGEDITLVMDYCKYSTDIADVELFLINDTVIPMTMPSPEPWKTGCGTISESVTIHSLPGIYKLGMTRTYHPNPIIWRKVRHQSNEFEVLALPEKATVTPEQLLRATASNHAELARTLATNKDLIAALAKALAANRALIAAQAEAMKRIDAQAALLQQQQQSNGKKKK